MKFWLSLVSVRESEQLPELARYAEKLGFHGLMIGDHIAWPKHITTPYPYSPDGKIFVPPDTPWPDPWVLFAHLGAITEKLHFASNIYLAALRDPFTVAKSVATAALLTNNRIICGVSAGWLKEEFEVAGVDFESRGRRLDEMLSVMRKLWTGEFVSHSGEFFTFEANCCPPPPRPVEIWCGGGAPPAMRRAARNDGWLPLPMTIAAATSAVADLRAMRKQAGLDPATLTVGLPLAEPVTQAGVNTLRDLALDDLIVIAPWLPSPWDVTAWLDPGDDMGQLSVKKKCMQRYAETVIHKIR